MFYNIVYLGSLLVGGIAAISLNHTAFNRPRQIRDDYLKSYNTLINPLLPGIELQVENHKNQFPNIYAIYTKEWFGCKRLDFIEFIVMTIYLVAELLLISLFFLNSNNCCIDSGLEFLLLLGYIVLFFGIFLTVLLFFILIFKGTNALDNLKSITEISNIPEITDNISLEGLSTKIIQNESSILDMLDEMPDQQVINDLFGEVKTQPNPIPSTESSQLNYSAHLEKIIDELQKISNVIPQK